MARKGRNLASFEDLANNINVNVDKNDNDIIDNEVSVNVNDDVNANNNDKNKDNDNETNNINDNQEKPNMDYLDKLIEGNMKKNEAGTVLTGIYLQKDLAQLLDRLAKKGGRGAKSKIVNEALRSIFLEKGLL